MKSYLFSSLVQRFGRGELAEFKRVHSCDWLLWEAGAWHPATRQTLVMNKLAPEGVPKDKAQESLVMGLETKPGQDQLTLGREDCDLVINDGTLSSRHLLFMKVEGTGWTVRDAGSRNGSWLDDVKLPPGMPYPLRNGARLKAGQVHLTFYEPAGLFSRLRQSAR